MQIDSSQFQLFYKQEEIQVQRHFINGQTIFRITYPNSNPPLIITQAKKSDSHYFWTSIPEGRLAEAEQIGELIEDFYKK